MLKDSKITYFAPTTLVLVFQYSIYNKVYVKHVTISKRIRVIYLKFVTLCPKSVKKWSKFMENSRNMTRNALFFAFSYKIVWLLNLFSINLHRFL